MLDVRIEELQARLSWYLDQVRRGESLAIRDHDTLVARVLPPDAEPRPIPDRVAQLVAQGLLTLKPPPRNLPQPIDMLPGDKSAVDYVLEQRR
jgi:antitoxin (DNA-binding transcriptional repressor) of toxin-antitoxin stability system